MRRPARIMTTGSVGHGPSGVAVNTPGTMVYVLNELDITVSVIDATTRTVAATMEVGDTAKSKSFTIGFIVSSYYNRNSATDDAKITVSK